MAFWDDFNADPAAYFGHGPSPANTVRSTEIGTNPFGNYFEDKPRSAPFYESRDAAPVMPAQPERPRHWTYDLLDLLKQFSGGKQQQGGGPVGATGGPAMAYVPPTGKGGGVDVVKLAMMIAGAGAGGGMMGGSGAAAGAPGAAAGAGGAGMGGAPAGTMGGSGAASGMSGGNNAMGMFSKFMGGGGGGGKDVPPPAQPMAMMQLPYMTIGQSESPGPIFGQNVIPSTLDVWRPRQKNSFFPGNPYG